MQITQGTIHDHAALRIGVANVYLKDGAPIARIVVVAADGTETSELYRVGDVVAIGNEPHRISAVVVGVGSDRGHVELLPAATP